MKSFLDNDFLIELNEKRCAEYASLAYQMASRFSMLFVFYSFVLAGAIPVLRLLLKQLLYGRSIDYPLGIGFLAFGIMLAGSIAYALPLIDSEEPGILKLLRYYYREARDFLCILTPGNEITLADKMNEQLKLLYNKDLEALASERYRRAVFLESCFKQSVYYAVSAFAIFTIVFSNYLLHY